MLRRLAFFLVCVIAVAAVLVWRLGALRGTYEANYLARASMLGRADLASLPADVHGFIEQPFVQISSPSGESLWRNAALQRIGNGATLPKLNSTVEIELDHGPTEETGFGIDHWKRTVQRLVDCPLPDGQSGWGVTLPVQAADGQTRIVTIAGSRRPYEHDWFRTAGWLAGGALIPLALLLALFPTNPRPLQLPSNGSQRNTDDAVANR